MTIGFFGTKSRRTVILNAHNRSSSHKQRIKPIKVKTMKTSSQRSNGVTAMGRLADKNILITGGNSGIGLAAAQEFDREGARVAICGLNEGSLQAAKETLGPGSLAIRADVSNLADLDTAP